MKQYLLLIHDSGETVSPSEEWDAFFDAAKNSGIFRGGSELGDSEIIGEPQTAKLSDRIAGYMRIDSDDKGQVLDLLKLHPSVIHGGSVELCEMPES